MIVIIIAIFPYNQSLLLLLGGGAEPPHSQHDESPPAVPLEPLSLKPL